jgi:hypothetical protein
MAYVIAKQGLTLRDCRGHTGKVTFYYTYDAAVAANVNNARIACVAIASAIEACSNALVVNIDGLGSVALNPDEFGANTAYANAETKARLAFQVTRNVVPVNYKISRMDIPAPILTDFMNDRETVNAADTNIAALVTALITPDGSSGRACTRDGAVFVGLLGGLLVRRRFQRKLTIYDKSANLDEPEE